MTRLTSPLDTTVCPLEMVLMGVSLPVREVVEAFKHQILTVPKSVYSEHSLFLAQLCSQEPEEGWHTAVLQWMKT